MAKDTDALADAMMPDSGSGAKSGGRRVRDSSQSGNNPIEAKDYSYTPKDQEGFNIETTEDESLEIARRAVQLAHGDGSDDGVSGEERLGDND